MLVSTILRWCCSCCGPCPTSVSSFLWQVRATYTDRPEVHPGVLHTTQNIEYAKCANNGDGQYRPVSCFQGRRLHRFSIALRRRVERAWHTHKAGIQTCLLARYEAFLKSFPATLEFLLYLPVGRVKKLKGWTTFVHAEAAWLRYPPPHFFLSSPPHVHEYQNTRNDSKCCLYKPKTLAGWSCSRDPLPCIENLFLSISADLEPANRGTSEDTADQD